MIGWMNGQIFRLMNECRMPIYSSSVAAMSSSFRVASGVKKTSYTPERNLDIYFLLSQMCRPVQALAHSNVYENLLSFCIFW